MDPRLLFSIFLWFLNWDVVYGANILMIQPVPAKSHMQFLKPLAEEIIKRGHNLTLISKNQIDDNFKSSYTLINLQKYYTNHKLPLQNLASKNKIKVLTTMFGIGNDISQLIFPSPEMQRIIQSKDHYDLIITEFFFYDTLFALGTKFNAPVVAVISQALLPFQNWIIGQEFPASYVPNTFSALTDNMNLLERIYNSFVNIFSILYYEFIHLPRCQAFINEYFHFEKGKVPQIRDTLRNISVILQNAHYSFGYPKPEIPRVINLAGLHFTSPQLLPETVKLFMDEAENGVIYLSLGSNISPDFVQQFGEIFTSTLQSVPHRVLMKWDKKLLSNVPRNFLVEEWLPQADVLNHPNCHLFISHGGLLSLLESLNASIPIVGIPFFFDQFYNLAIVEYYEIGTVLQKEDVSTKLLEKVDEVLKNPKYKRNIQNRSNLFRDRLVNPLDEAMYWVDHVIKHKDASHLMPHSAKLAWYKLYTLDVFAIFLISFLSVWYLTKFLIQFILRRILFLRDRIYLKFKNTKKIYSKTE